MAISTRLAIFATCAFALAFSTATVPAKAAQPYNAADAARKYCGGAYKRYCKRVPTGGIDSLNCLKEHVARLPSACRKAVQQL